jgi:serine/threonine-protein kinase
VDAVRDGSGDRVAIKYLSPALAGDPAFMQRFRAEAQALRELRVPQVVQVHDFVEQPRLGAAVITELVNGVSLREMIERRGPARPEAALTVLKETLLALAAAHALGIVHGDCKPENVLADTAGNIKLADFGWTVRYGERQPPAGMPPYLAPELWQGAGESPAADLYAAAAVFFFCLAGRPPFTGTDAQLREQHGTAAVPADLADPPLHRLITRGMAKDPALRPHSAVAFAAELEALAVSAYGAGWEERGRGQLAERAAAILPLAWRAGQGGTPSPPFAPPMPAAGGGRRQTVAIAAAAATAVVVIAGVATAVTLTGNSPGHAVASPSGTSSRGTPAMSFSGVAAVTPAAATSRCTTPTTFTYSGTLHATAPGTLTYRWVYSSGKPGPEQTISFTTAGDWRVTGETVSATAAGRGWGKLQVISPVAWNSNEARYTLTCEAPAVQPATGQTAAPATSHPATATAAASPKATPPGTLHVTTGTVTVQALLGTAYTGYATVSGGKGPYTWSPVTGLPPGLTATANGGTLTISGTPTQVGSFNPATSVKDSSSPALTSTIGFAILVQAPSLNVTVNAPASATNGKPYSGTVTATGGDGTYQWSQPALPAGLKATANGATLTISGTPTQSATTTVSGQVSDGESPAQAIGWVLSLTVSWPPITLTATMPATATVGKLYTGTVTAAGGNGATKVWTVTGLPAGLKATEIGATLTVSGTPTAASKAVISVKVAEGSLTAAHSYSVVVG